MMEYRIPWSIPNAGPSVTTLHFQGTLDASTAEHVANTTRAFFDSLKGTLPDDVTINFDSEVREIRESDGQLIGVETVAAPLPVTGTVTGTWPAGTGYRIVWQTPRIIDGRRVRGTTFIVPIGSGLFTTGGQLSNALISDVTPKAAAYLNNLVAGGVTLAVYSRPTPSRLGTSSGVFSVAVPAIVATLRGRKY